MNPQPSDEQDLAFALSEEARALRNQLLARADVNFVYVQSANTDFVATATGVTSDGETLFRLAREATAEEALLKLLAAYRMLEHHGLLRSLPSEPRQLRVAPRPA